MATATVAPRSASAEVAALLGSPEIRGLIDHLQQTRWTGRPGFPIRTMVGMALAKSMYAISTWAKLVRLVEEHAALQTALGCVGDVPSQWACYRFAKKLRENGDALDACISRVIAELHRRLPDYGRDVAIDASDMPAYGNGHRHRFNRNGPLRERFADPDATWGYRSAVSTRRGGGFYGFKLQAAVCTKTGLPVAWEVAPARANESTFVADLLDTALARGFVVETMAADKAYDIQRVYDECAERGCQPIIPVKQTPGRQARRPPAPIMRARRLALHRLRLQTRRSEVALSDRRVRPGLDVAPGEPPAPIDPARDAAVEGPLPPSLSR